MKNNPKDIRGVVGMVETLASQKKMDEAIKTVQTTLEQDPKRDDYRTVLANLYARSDRFDEAIKIFEELSKSQPRNGELVYALMMWRRRRGAKWRPINPTAIPPHVAGRYTIIWTIDKELAKVMREVLDFNRTSLENAAGKSVKSWAVPVRCVYGFDETAQVIEIGTEGGGA